MKFCNPFSLMCLCLSYILICFLVNCMIIQWVKWHPRGHGTLGIGRFGGCNCLDVECW